MHQKDYVLLARALKAARKAHSPTMWDVHDGVAHYICVALKYDNPKFDRSRFEHAAGVVTSNGDTK